ncbi:BMP-binding endothelial regulator protein-like [Ptychodera flava]|uniref:BMP-binding endothelial regulator protein-like n=1 Tax=Ptychodera flava TaxID=63121 RepID=UPI003969E041
MSPGQFLCLLISTLTICQNLAQPLSGGPLSCSEDGEKVEIPLITVDPCISCYCQNNAVECFKEKCKSIDDCALVITSFGFDCCQRCKGCSFNGEVHDSGSIWRSSEDNCELFRCQEGVVTSSVTQCAVSCKNPILQEGQCCPSCEGCSYGGQTYKDGTMFKYQDDPCVECACEGGNIRCEKRACPVLSCPLKQQEKAPGECCPKCAVQRNVYDLANRCLFRKEVYSDGEAFEEDKCTTCICLDSTVICRRENCPILECDEADIEMEEGACCATCKMRTCTFGNRTYLEGDTWSDHGDPCIVCTCSQETVTCQTLQCDNIVDCPRDHTLQTPEGECCPRCIENMGVCTVFGDPHYKTFDGRLYNFQGTCKYVLTSDCRHNTFIVRVRNDPRNTASFSWTQSVHLTVGGVDIKLQQDFNVKYKQERIKIPYEETGEFSAVMENSLLKITTALGIIIIWDGDSYLEVLVPPSYKDKLCGLCGNYNGNMWDDYTTRGGVVKNHAPMFAETWRIGRRSVCGRPERKRIKSKDRACEEGSKNRKYAERKCKILKSKVFEECRKVVPLDHYYSSCVNDVCECPSDGDCQCEAAIAYHRECIREGAEVKWKKRHVCKVDICPQGGVYEMCAPACKRTCANKDTKKKCKKLCKPGCTCPGELVLHGNKCIEPDECPK